MKARAKVRPGRKAKAAAHFERAYVLEASDAKAARDAYRAVLEIHAGHLEASINLGRLMHLAGELAAAEAIYLAAEHGSALLSFNIALLLEDLERDEEALVAYLAALALDPALHDAHYYLSVLHERQRRPREALKHLLAYRRLTRN